jgi:hypothetical protein
MGRQKLWGRALSAACVVALSSAVASGGIIFTDGFGDGDRDNNGLDAGAAATDPTDVGVPWYGVGGTSSIVHTVVDDSSGIGTGNALQLHNTGSNNRPHVAPFSAVTLGDGDRLVLRFDMRVVSLAPATSDRSIRFGFYNAGATPVTGDLGSTATEPNDDVGYNARVDAGADASNSTSMDVTRDDSAAATIIAGTATGIGVSSTDAVNRLADNLKHAFELTLERSGTSMLVTLRQDGNAAITGTDVTPPGFTFNEVMVGPRSNAAMDLRFDNFSVEYVPFVPEPASVGVVGVGLAAVGMRRRAK